jgi:hypothetical protein
MRPTTPCSQTNGGGSKGSQPSQAAPRFASIQTSTAAVSRPTKPGGPPAPSCGPRCAAGWWIAGRARRAASRSPAVSRFFPLARQPSATGPGTLGCAARDHVLWRTPSWTSAARPDAPGRRLTRREGRERCRGSICRAKVLLPRPGPSRLGSWNHSGFGVLFWESLHSGAPTMRAIIAATFLGLILVVPAVAQAQTPGLQQTLQGLLSGNQGQDQAVREAYRPGQSPLRARAGSDDLSHRGGGGRCPPAARGRDGSLWPAPGAEDLA